MRSAPSGASGGAAARRSRPPPSSPPEASDGDRRHGERRHDRDEELTALHPATLLRGLLGIVANAVAELTNISLSRGAPSLDIVAVDELRAAADRAFRHDPGGAFAYGTSAGYPRLLEWLAKKHEVAPERLVATNGSMQADAFLFQQLVAPGDVVVVEAPTYDRTLLSLRKLGAEILAIPLEEDGIDVEALASALDGGARPKLAHIIPNFQNPAGCTLSLEKRRRLLELAAAHDFTIFEDDPYVELRFEGEQHPTMLELDAGEGRVVYASSFSKTVCPGIRVGYLVGAPDLIGDRPQARHRDLHLAEHGRPGDRGRVLPLGGDRALDRDGQGGAPRAPRRHLRRPRPPPARRALRHSRGRLLPLGRPARGQRRRARSRRAPRSAAWCSSRARDFLLEGGESSLRLAYSAVPPDQIEEGIARVADAYRELAGAAA